MTTKPQHDAGSQPGEVRSSEGLGPLPEPDYYAAADSDIRPRLLHSRKEVEMHLKHLEKDGGRPVPWEGNVWGLYVETNALRIVADAVAAERERCAKLVEALRPCERGDCDDLAAAIRRA